MAKDRFTGKVAIVTGGGSGLGKAFCLGLANEGAAVVCPDIDAKSAEETAAEINNNGGKAIAVQTDVTAANDVSSMVNRATEEFGQIDILINNAGVVRRQGLLSTSVESWNKMVEVDLKGPFLVTQAVARHMMQRKSGKVVNISSIAGVTGLLSTAYTAAKAGLIGLTRLWAGELAEYNINVNCIAPGFIATPINAAMRSTPVGKQMEEKMPMGWGTPELIVGPTLFMCSDDAAYVSGQTLVVDGGFTTFADMGKEYRDFDAGVK